MCKERRRECQHSFKGKGMDLGNLAKFRIAVVEGIHIHRTKSSESRRYSAQSFHSSRSRRRGLRSDRIDRRGE